MENICDIDILVQDNHNFNKGTKEGKKLMAKSFAEFGAGRSILIDKDNRIIAGNKSALAASDAGIKKVRIIETTGDEIIAVKRTDIELDSKKGREMALADNATTQVNLSWDEAELSCMADEYGFDIPEWGVDFGMESEEKKEVEEVGIKEDAPERCQPGDMWRLGDHLLLCGDSTSAASIARLMGGEVVDLVFTDPPYGMKKEGDGVLNDNLNFDGLLEFNKKWIPLTFASLKSTGSWYCWGIDEPLMDIYSNILRPMAKRKEITFRNLITWNKGSGQGQNSDVHRMFARADEKCLFVMCGAQGFANDTDHYFEGFEPIRLYLKGEADKVGLNANKLKEICGVGMYSHWFSKSQWELLTEEHYKRIQEYYKYEAFRKEYEEIRKEYEEIRKEYYSTRAYFNNTHDNMNNVWHFQSARYTDNESRVNDKHATPKPIALCARAILSSSREGETVLDAFGGSGSTLIACEQLGRKCRMMELSPHYCDVIIERWETYTGKKAEKIEDEIAVPL